MFEHTVVSPRFVRRAALVLFALLLIPVAAAAQEAPKPTQFVKDQHTKVMALLDRKVTGDEVGKRAEELRVMMSALVDYEDLAVRSLGKHWGERSEEEKVEYKALFRELVELSYVDRLGNKNPNAKYEVDWEAESVTDGKAHVICFVMYEDTETELEFILKPAGASWLVHDLLLDGSSLEDTYHRKYAEQIEKEGYAELVKKMKEKIAELKK